MMAQLLFNTVVILLVQYAFSQDTIETKSEASRDPVAAILKELGMLILDVDKAYGEITAPKVEFEDRVAERMYGRPRSEYFSKVRENYRKIQRTGPLGIGDLSLSSNMFGANVKNDNQESAVDVSIPSLPLQLKVKSKIPTVQKLNSQKYDNVEKTASKESDSHFSSKMKVGDSEIKVNSVFALPDTPRDEYTYRIHESGPVGSAERFIAKEPESRFASTMKVGDSEIRVDSVFTFPDTPKNEYTGLIHEYGSERVGSTKRFVPKTPVSRFSSKIKMGDSEIKLDSALRLTDIPSQAKLTKRIQEANTEVMDSTEEFATETPKSRLTNTIEGKYPQINEDLACFFPSESSKAEKSALSTGDLVSLGYLGEGEKRGKPTLLVERADNELVSLFTRTYNEFLFSEKESKESKPMDINTSVRGRILGDLFFSESIFDKLTKEALQNSHWALDSNLSPYKVLKNIEETAKLLFSRRRLESRHLSEGSNSELNIDANTDFMFPQVAAERLSESASIDGPTSGSIAEETGTQLSNSDHVNGKPVRETILSAVTDGGVPVKLRIGSEVGNPYKFLHRILSEAGVTLSVSMTKKRDTKKAEKAPVEVKQATPSLCVDLSNENQRDSFLRTLKKFQAIQIEE